MAQFILSSNILSHVQARLGLMHEPKSSASCKSIKKDIAQASIKHHMK